MKKIIILSVALALTAVFAVSYARAQVDVNEWLDKLTSVPKGGIFSVIFQEGASLSGQTTAAIIKDKETGCHYVFVKDGQGAGLTPRISRSGKYICD